jgi:hypothetical protein
VTLANLAIQGYPAKSGPLAKMALTAKREVLDHQDHRDLQDSLAPEVKLASTEARVHLDQKG